MLTGRVALVTGGGRGIGRAISLGLAEDGADVAVSFRRDEAAARQTVAGIEALGRRARAYRASIDTFDESRALAEAVVRDFGFVDILVHNAGVASRRGAVADTEPAELERVLRIHAIGPHELTRLVLPSMRERPRGDVVVISSAATLRHPALGASYNMGKAALESLALTLAREERRHGIHVNIVAPGLVETEMGRRLVRATAGIEDLRQLDASMPFGHVCRPEEIADAVRFLVSERAGYVTGQKLVVDGGGR